MDSHQPSRAGGNIGQGKRLHQLPRRHQEEDNRRIATTQQTTDHTGQQPEQGPRIPHNHPAHRTHHGLCERKWTEAKDHSMDRKLCKQNWTGLQ